MRNRGSQIPASSFVLTRRAEPPWGKGQQDIESCDPMR
jgi:hypothetical protein